jgi:esterase/lipase superfamily enzyme
VNRIVSAIKLGTLCLALVGCATDRNQPEAMAAVADGAEVVKVFYGTNRNRRVDEESPRKFYGQDRGQYEVGFSLVARVTDSTKNSLLATQPMKPTQFREELRAAVKNAPEPTVFVFVHGFLRPFSRVTEQVADFANVAGFAGVPVMWSWPSTNNPARYTVDETNVKWAQQGLSRFLREILEESGAERVHLVGHSLGCRGLSTVMLQKIIPDGVDLGSVGEFVLLAPDIDREIFRRDLGPALVAAGLRVSLYTSSNDKAMASAMAIHGYRRAGDSSAGPLLVPGVETIDVTSANHSFLGHSYFGEGEMVAQDLGLLLNEGQSAAHRPGMDRVEKQEGHYWLFTVDN